MGESVHSFSYFHVDKFIFGYSSEVIMAYYIVWEKVKGHSHVLIPIKRILEYIFLMLAPANQASRVLMSLFHMIFDDSMSAVHVVSSKG